MLQNPYAHIEQLEEQRAQSLYENPYRYTEQCDTDAIDLLAHKAHGIKAIEQVATNLQRRLWAKRDEFGLGSNARPVDILNPEYAAQLLGYSYSSRPSLGWISHGRSRIVVAGLIDHSKRLIEVATDVEPRTARFTAAHEIGHAVLHPYQAGLHRDRPINGIAESRDRTEYEADKFATFFLMPRKHVTEEFLKRFIQPFRLQEETSFALLGKPYNIALQLLPTRRHISRAMADAIQFNGRSFTSLADYFGVSTEAMAIRLEELELVDG